MLSQCYPIVSLNVFLGNSCDWHSLCLPCPSVLKQGGTGGLLKSAGRGQLLWNGNWIEWERLGSLKEGTETYVPSPQSLGPCWCCRLTCSAPQRKAEDATQHKMHANVHWLILVALKAELVSLARFLFVGQYEVCLRSFLQRMRVTYVTEMLFANECNINNFCQV